MTLNLRHLTQAAWLSVFLFRPRVVAKKLVCFGVLLANQLALAQETPTKYEYLKEGTLGVMQIGVSASGAPVLRRIEYGFTFPAPIAGTDGNPLRQCVNKAVSRGLPLSFGGDWLWKQFDSELASIIGRSQPPYVPVDDDELLDSDEYAKSYANTIAALQVHTDATVVSEISDMLGEVSRELSTRIELAGCASNKNKVFLTLVQRVCKPTDDSDCKPYLQKPSLTYLTGRPEADRFEVLLKWSYAHPPSPPGGGAPVSGGLMKPDYFVLISASGVAAPSVQNDIFDNNTPPVVIDALEEQRGLERMVLALRKGRLALPEEAAPIAGTQLQPRRIPGQLLKMLNTSQQLYVRFADAFAASDALIATLPNKTADKLLVINDKLAQLRVRECLLNRRVAAINSAGNFDAAALEKCTGYKFANTDELEACLKLFDTEIPQTLSRCAPAISTDPASARVLTVLQFDSSLDTAQQLALSSITGRLSTLNYKDLAGKALGPCAQSADPDSLANCLFDQQVGANAKADLDRVRSCVANPSTNKSSVSLAECIASSKLNTEQLKGMKRCLNGATGGDYTECIVVGGVDAETLRKMNCLRDKSDPMERAACIAKMGDAAKYAACIEKPMNERLTCLAGATSLSLDKLPGGGCLGALDAKTAAACAKSIGIKLPPGLDTALQCAGAGSGAGVFGCLAKDKVGGDAGKLLACATQSNFNAAGTGACMAGNMLKFNEDLMMASTCIAETGGQPVAAGACTFGKLAMREMAFCRNEKFGEGKCFGKNNTLVKTFKLDANPLAVAYINYHLDMARTAMSFAENPGRTLGDVGHHAAKSIHKAHEDVVNGAGRLARGAVKVAERALHVKVRVRIKVKL